MKKKVEKGDRDIWLEENIVLRTEPQHTDTMQVHVNNNLSGVHSLSDKTVRQKMDTKRSIITKIVFPRNCLDSNFQNVQCVKITQCFQRGLKYKALASYLHNISKQRALTSVIRVSQGRLTGGLVGFSYLKPPCLLSSLLITESIRDLQNADGSKLQSCL